MECIRQWLGEIAQDRTLNRIEESPLLACLAGRRAQLGGISVAAISMIAWKYGVRVASSIRRLVKRSWFFQDGVVSRW